MWVLYMWRSSNQTRNSISRCTSKYVHIYIYIYNGYTLHTCYMYTLKMTLKMYLHIYIHVDICITSSQFEMVFLQWFLPPHQLGSGFGINILVHQNELQHPVRTSWLSLVGIKLKESISTWICKFIPKHNPYWESEVSLFHTRATWSSRQIDICFTKPPKRLKHWIIVKFHPPKKYTQEIHILIT